jgi:hypothetical protein
MIIPEPVDWLNFRKCRVCNAASGDACISRSGRVTGGRPDGAITRLPLPHTLRRRRAGR